MSCRVGPTPWAALAAVTLAIVLAGCAAPSTGSETSVGAGQEAASSSAVTGSGSGASAVAPGSGSAASAGSATVITSSTPDLAATPPTSTSALPAVPAAPSVPTLFLTADGGLAGEPPEPGVLTINPADGQTRDGEPYRPIVFAGSGLTMTYTGGATSFTLAVDAGDVVGSATQLRISVDLTGDGTWDRVETYRYFATDPIPDAELYTESAGTLTADGAWGDLTNGVVQVEVWAALGDTPSTLELGDASFVTLPMA